MPWTSEHTKWLVDTGERLKTADDKNVDVWEFCHEQDDEVLSAWAKHFRNHYCLDTDSLFQLIPLNIRNDRSKSKDKKNHLLTWDILSFAEAHIGGWASLNEVIRKIEKKYGESGFSVDAVTPQFEIFSQTLSSIESSLLSNWDANENGLSEADSADLTEQTLAYFLADEEKREQIQIPKLFPGANEGTPLTIK